MTAPSLNPDTLAAALLKAVRQQRFEALPDYHHGAQPIAHFPSIDLAVIGFPRNGLPVYANVLFSREHPDGLIAEIGAGAGPVGNIHYLKDQTDSTRESPAWFRDADWDAMQWQSLAGEGGLRFVEPYPASLVKMMVAVGIARQIDLGVLRWQDDYAWGGQTRMIAVWCEAMITESCNDATTALVRRLHESGALGPDGHNEVEQRFAEFGLSTLRLADTRPDGGWRIPDGAGVGHLCMTAWDAARLFWLLDADAPPAPWREGSAATEPLLAPATCARLRAMLARQGLHTVLSSNALAGQNGWVPGMPARLAQHWIGADGSVRVTPEHVYPPDVRWANDCAEVIFAHKTGGTDNYCSDAGIVIGVGGHRRHYIVAMISNMGKRYAAPPDGVVNGKVAGLGRAIDDLMKNWLEEK
jgi:hypothetical protein